MNVPPSRKNPFQTYRDPETGRWMVEKTPVEVDEADQVLDGTQSINLFQVQRQADTGRWIVLPPECQFGEGLVR